MKLTALRLNEKHYIMKEMMTLVFPGTPGIIKT